MAFERLADRLAGRRVPDARRLVVRRGDDALAVGAERRAPHNIFMAFERLADRLAGRGVPDPRRLVIRRGDDALAVGAERRATHSASWPLSGSPIGLPVAASQIRAVLSSDAVTMRLPSGLNAALSTTIVMALEGSPIGWPVAASQIRAVLSIRRGDDALAVGAERRAQHRDPHGL